MSLLTILVVLLVVGCVLWAIDKWAPMEANSKMMLKVLVLAIVVIWFLREVGAFQVLEKVRI